MPALPAGAAGGQLRTAGESVSQHDGVLGTAPGGVLFLAGDPVARAHHPSLIAAALPDPHAPGRGGGEPALIVRILEERPRLRRVPAAQRQVLVKPVRPHDPSGVHLAVRVEQGLVLALRASGPGRTSSAANSPRDWPSPCSPDSEPP